ncbi:MAG: DUF559 domain-containing protein [bacterium]
MSFDSKHKLVPIAKEISRELRRNQTKAEQIFWENVRGRRFLGLKFYRQYPLFVDDNGRETFLVADFFCHEKKLVVEIDGKIHDYQKGHDELRERLIRERTIVVKRFKNEEVEQDISRAMKSLEDLVGAIENSSPRRATEAHG